MRQVAEWYAPGGLHVAAASPVPDASDLAAVLDAMDAAVVAVRTGDTAVIANAAARALYALPEHRPAVIDDLACRVRIYAAQGRRRLGVDELPLIRALSGRPVETEAIVLALDPEWPGEAQDPASVPGARRLLLRARPVLDAGNEISGSVCTAQDITDLHIEHALLARRATELAAIHEATRAILTDSDARLAVCRAARAVSGAAAASLFEPDGQGHLVCTTHEGADPRGLRLPEAGPSIVARVFASGRHEVLQGGEADRRQPGTGRRAAAADRRAATGRQHAGALPGRLAHRVRAAVWLPVTSRGRCIAVLSLAFTDGAPVREHLPVLEILAGETAVAIERQDLLSRLRREAASDGLTGAANRRVWEEELPRALADAERDAVPLSVVMLDLDHFKRYNDTHGHPAGDALLQEAVARWRRLLDPGELLCRYGGEEFVVLLPGCGPGEASRTAERLRAVVPAGQTCSAGVAAWDGREPPERLVARMDSALYAAKLAGRDRVEVAPGR